MVFDSDRAKRVRKNAANGIKPLVTLIVTTYNQEKYICEAIKSALAQAYSPLEIIISDDCSKDSTWEIVKSCVAGYSGPHKIILNRNSKNFGVTAHLNKLYAMASGDFVTYCSGDDVALPDKIRIMVDRWAMDEYRPMVCWTNMYWLNADGTKGDVVYKGTATPQTRAQFLRNQATAMPGASAGFSMDVYDIFGPINQVHSPSEDVACAIRGVLLDHLVYINIPTMYWRRVGLWTGMQGKPEYAKKMYYDVNVKAEAVARQALVDALEIKDEQSIVAMCKWWNESSYRRNAFVGNIFAAPVLFIRAWRNGGAFLHLLRWTYHALKYRFKYTWHDSVFGSKVKHGYMGDREIIYERN